MGSPARPITRAAKKTGNKKQARPQTSPTKKTGDHKIAYNLSIARSPRTPQSPRAHFSTAMPNWILYGANGYTGELIAREAHRRGLRPILAGRHPQAITKLAEQLACQARVFDL